MLCDVRNQDSVYSREEEGGSGWEQGLPGCWRLSILIQVAITKVCSFSDHLLSYDWHTFLYVSSPSITKLKTFKTSVHLAWPTNKKHGYQKKKNKKLPIYFSHKFRVTTLSPALFLYSIKMMKLEGLPG